jgi:hypothetical protein
LLWVVIVNVGLGLTLVPTIVGGRGVTVIVVEAWVIVTGKVGEVLAV